MMPLALKMVDPHESEDIGYYQKEKRKAKIFTRLANVIFYVLILAYFLVSTITGKFIWRTSINLLFFYIAAVFCFSLLKIRGLIEYLSRRATIKTNNWLLNISLAMFIAEGFTYGGVFANAIVQSKVDPENTVASCQT